VTAISPDGLLTVREVAEAMRVSTMTVYRLIKAEDLPAIRVGKHFRIRRRDLAAYLDARTVGGGPDEIGRGGEIGRSGETGRDDQLGGSGSWPAA